MKALISFFISCLFMLNSLSVVGQSMPPDFIQAAQKATPAVVHIKAKVTPERQRFQQNPGQFGVPDPFRQFFDDDFWDRYRGEQQPRESSGSGVLMTSNGYIITNNHVIQNADQIEVITHDKQQFEASVVGTDKMTDIALLKIDAEEMPFIELGNSNEVQVGEWVLAVGNPFNLSSTVTAGIVSAKARNINILEDQAAIESFIQTDAAVNPGNSGGALVNSKGNLIGINTAIATPTGTYAGYAFAIPVNIVEKVMKDLRQYGKVKRGYLGVTITGLTGQLAKELGIERTRGVLVREVLANSAAAEAGLQSDDVIIRVNGEEVESSPELQEKISLKRPGDKITLTYLRNGNRKTATVILKDEQGGAHSSGAPQSEILDNLGIELSELTKEEKNEFGVPHGIQVVGLYSGPVKRQTNIQEGFIIMGVDGQPVDSIRDFERALQNKRGGVLMEGKYPGSRGVYYYGFGM